MVGGALLHLLEEQVAKWNRKKKKKKKVGEEEEEEKKKHDVRPHGCAFSLLCFASMTNTTCSVFQR